LLACRAQTLAALLNRNSEHASWSESYAATKSSPEFRKTHIETDGPVNQARAFSGAREKSARKERKWTDQDRHSSSLGLRRQDWTVRKYLVFLGIPRKVAPDARIALALTHER
jgi:hypothetical protein